MSTQHYEERITTDPNIMLGKPVIKGTRITVELILRKLSEGMSAEELLTAYPNLTKEDIFAALLRIFKMKNYSADEIIAYLKRNKSLFYERFGITRIGIFGSFARREQTPSSDIDMVIEIEKDRKSIHNFLQIKRFLEEDLGGEIDLGFEHSLKPIIREKVKKQIIYA